MLNKQCSNVKRSRLGVGFVQLYIFIHLLSKRSVAQICQPFKGGQIYM